MPSVGEAFGSFLGLNGNRFANRRALIEAWLAANPGTTEGSTSTTLTLIFSERKISDLNLKRFDAAVDLIWADDAQGAWEWKNHGREYFNRPHLPPLQDESGADTRTFEERWGFKGLTEFGDYIVPISKGHYSDAAAAGKMVEGLFAHPGNVPSNNRAFCHAALKARMSETSTPEGEVAKRLREFDLAIGAAPGIPVTSLAVIAPFQAPAPLPPVPPTPPTPPVPPVPAGTSPEELFAQAGSGGFTQEQVLRLIAGCDERSRAFIAEVQAVAKAHRVVLSGKSIGDLSGDWHMSFVERVTPKPG